jgi:enterochelin esterase-like enzyme
MDKNKILPVAVLVFGIGLAACTAPGPAVSAQPTQTAAPQAAASVTTAPDCTKQGTIGNDHVPHPTQGFDKISFEYYLPPCYPSLTQESFPVLYLITLGYENELSATANSPMSLAQRMIQAGTLAPVIIIVPDQLIGYGSDAALTKDLVPYVDGKFRTMRDRLQRGVGGISNGAAIAVRMAFQFPETFASVGLLSGGLADGEQERFEGWVTRTAPALWPRVRIDVGDQDAIISLTHILTGILDKYHVPYTLNIGHGTHSWAFWSGRMEPYLLWLARAWQ